MKKPVRSVKTSAKARTGKPAAKGKRPSAPAVKGTASREEVRREVRRTQVPRQFQRPAERSRQRRSGKP
jgi:hypothetical protein